MQKNIYSDIEKLVAYGVATKLIETEDVVYTRNQIMELLLLDGPTDEEASNELDSLVGLYKSKSEEEITEILDEVLDAIIEYALEKNIISEDSVTYRDLFDTKLMNLMIKRPSDVIRTFNEEYKKSPEAATDYYYKLSKNSNYIRRGRVKKDLKWKSTTKFGELDITVNLSKPEKDPKAIAAAKNMKQSSYPKCLLCYENEGYAGRINHPARQNHRIIPLVLNKENWFIQYSPYVYYNEHCIVFNKEHTPIVISRDTFVRLFDFVKLFPHYTIGSNADLPIVGGSILTHNHFQGGCYEFPMERAEIEKRIEINGFEDIKAGVVKWPLTVIRLTSENVDRLVELSDKILNKWKNYSDEENNIFAYTKDDESGEEIPHNTITPIVRKRGSEYEIDLVLRNNVTTEEHPDGVFHPHAHLHHIKKENIGLIEVMGLAVLPKRLKEEMEKLKELMLAGKDLYEDEDIKKHADWATMIMKKYENISRENIDRIIEDEIGLVFAEVLEDCGVYKLDEKGMVGIEKFVKSV